LDHFGPIQLHRIRHSPPPGAATEQDVIDIHASEDRLYELVDGVLVEKAMGAQESYLAVLLCGRLLDFRNRNDLGIVLGADGMIRLAPQLVRIPDVSFISWNRLKSRSVPKVPILGLAPDLAIEVLSPSNTQEEMKRKLDDYFIDPEQRTTQVFTPPDQTTLLQEYETLQGGEVLPGFTLALRDLFARLA
jgi:Uma2 family endonuclease